MSVFDTGRKISQMRKDGLVATRSELTSAMEEVIAQQEEIMKCLRGLSAAIQTIGNEETKKTVRKALQAGGQSVFKGAF